MYLLTYSGVVGHLVSHVLPAAHLLGVDTNLFEEELDTAEEVAKSLVVDNLLYSQCD